MTNGSGKDIAMLKEFYQYLLNVDSLEFWSTVKLQSPT
jgi:hypothetical protein